MALRAHLASHLNSPAASDPDQPGDIQVEGRRRPRRTLRLETSGSLPSGLEANVTIHNLSAAGLLLETDMPLGVGEVLAIDLPNAGPVGAEIVWESGHLFGCAFQQALGEAALAAVQLRGNAPRSESLSGAATRLPVSLGQTADDSLGYRFNKLRRERGMTLAQVASALEVSKPTVWAWEKGKARPLPERIAGIAQVLGVDEAELTDGSSLGEGAALVEDCRQRIAAAYGTHAKNVRIMIEV